MRKLLLYFIFLVSYPTIAQHQILSHYPVNPTLFNPAFTGKNGLSEILLNQRIQWIGINDAPLVSTFQFSTAVGSRIGVGIRAQHISRGAIQSNAFDGIFAYKVPFGQRTGITFGLSGGLSSIGLNQQSSYNPSDPAVLRFAENELHPDLKFGVNYHIKNFNLGITFTEMIHSAIYMSKPADNTDIKFYENYIVNFDYKFKIPASKFSLEPFVLYTTDKYTYNFFEAGSLFKYDNLLYIGGSYRQEYGINLLSGLELKKLSVGYGYELASHMVNSVSQGTHELQLSYRFGRQPKEKKKTHPKEKQQIIEEIDEDPIEEIVKDEEKAQDESEEFKRLEEEPAHAYYYRGNSQNELPVGFYIIGGSFQTPEHAQKRTAELSKQGMFAAFAYNSESKLYYVYVYRSDSLQKTQNARDSYRKKAPLKDAWLLEIKERE